MNQLKADFPIHPFLFGIFPIILLYENNIFQVEITEILGPSILIISVISIVIFCCYLIKINLNKIALFLSIILFLNFSFRPIEELFININFFTLPRMGYTEYFAIIYFVLFLLSAYFIARTKKTLTEITKILNFISIILILTAVLYISLTLISSHNSINNNSTESKHIDFSGSSLQPSDRDIYYIIPDRYPGADTLQGLYQYDNSPFINNLTKRGFHIINHSRSNYGETILSLPSSLNMEYLDSPLTYNRMMDKIENNNVMTFLKSQGYTIVFFRSASYYTNENQNADIEYNERFFNEGTEFQMALKQNSFFIRVINYLSVTFFKYQIIYPDGPDSKTNTLNTLSNLSKISKIPGKKFIFTHFEIPKFIQEECDNSCKNNPRDYEERYIADLNNFNLLLDQTLKEIINKSEPQPIIIIQSDHGVMFRPGIDDPGFVQQWTYLDSDDYIPNNFNAYYLPDGGDSILYPNITPVNSFRLIFNYYFNTSFEKLPDKTFTRDKTGVREKFMPNSTSWV